MTGNSNLPAGRPVDKKKTKKIFDSVDEILLSEGVASLSMERIARLAGISKATLYRRFGSLKGVVNQYVESEVQPVFSLISSHESDEGNTNSDFVNRLTNYGTELMSVISRPRIIAFDNAILAGGAEFSSIKTELYQNGPAKVLDLLSELLEREKVSSDFFNSQQLADVLFHLWRSGFYDQCKVTGKCVLNETELRCHVSERTRYFLSTVAIGEKHK